MSGCAKPLIRFGNLAEIMDDERVEELRAKFDRIVEEGRQKLSPGSAEDRA